MTKYYQLNLIGFLCLSMISTRSLAQIPNPGFENWTSGSCFIINTYDDPDGWGSINVLTCPGGGFTCLQASGADAHSGTYALELTTINIFGQIAPGIIATGVINQTTRAVDGGFALTTPRPDKLIGWYKYLPAPPDTFFIGMDVYSSTTTGPIIGMGSITGTSTVSTYTKFIVDIPYTSGATPDSAKITILSSPGQNGTPGTELFVDDLALVSCAGFTATPTTVNTTCTTATGS